MERVHGRTDEEMEGRQPFCQIQSLRAYCSCSSITEDILCQAMQVQDVDEDGSYESGRTGAPVIAVDAGPSCFIVLQCRHLLHGRFRRYRPHPLLSILILILILLLRSRSRDHLPAFEETPPSLSFSFPQNDDSGHPSHERVDDIAARPTVRTCAICNLIHVACSRQSAQARGGTCAFRVGREGPIWQRQRRRPCPMPVGTSMDTGIALHRRRAIAVLMAESVSWLSLDSRRQAGRRLVASGRIKSHRNAPPPAQGAPIQPLSGSD